LVRCGCQRHAIAGVEADVPKSDQVKLLASAISWHLGRPQSAEELHYIVASQGAELPEHSAAFQLLAPYLKRIPIRIEIGSRLLPTTPVSFPEKKVWVDALNERAGVILPDSLRDLAAGRPAFRWYRALTEKAWSGRLRGLEICTSDAAGRVVFEVGQAGQGKPDSDLRAAFLNAMRLRDPGVEESREIIARLCSDADLAKLSSHSEHALEFQVLAGQIAIPIGGVSLVPVEREVPCQFPALWWPRDRKRHIDALMRCGKVPWVAELKVSTGGQGKYYREGIVQAALYREFIRAADWMEAWFRSRDLDRSQCAAVVVIPKLRGGQQERLRRNLKDLAAIFDVHLVELAWPQL
jgi:hypothetical protein